MEESQLNFEKPLLSVRRFSLGESDSKRKTDKSPPGAPWPPRYQSELKSGPVRNPGTVPFSWEQNPGRPKDRIEHKSCVVDNRPPTVPNLPPGRSSKLDQQNLDESIPKYNADVIPSFDEDSKQSGGSKDEKEDAGSTKAGEEKDQDYVDARGTLSRTESFFINCSVSGLSGLEDSDTRVSENPFIDPHTRDLIMCRFLPAAMAMTSESPQHPHWSLPVVSQLPKKSASDETKPRLRYGTDYVPEYSRYHENEDGGNDVDFDEHEKFLNGLLPCIVNPLWGTSVRTLAPTSPFRKPLQLLSCSGSCSEADTERHVLDRIEQRPKLSFETLKLRVSKKELKNNNRIHLSNNGTTEISAYKKLEVSDITADSYGVSVEYNGSVQYNATCRNSEEATNPDGNTSELNKVVRRSFEELLAEENISNELVAGSPVAEKTVYVVSEDKVEPPTFKFHDSDIEKQLEGKNHQLFMEQFPDFHEKPSRYERTRQLRTGTSTLFSQEHDRYKGSRTLHQEFIHPRAPPGTEKLVNDLELPLPPPLPKTPSDSWLGRTLPSMSAKKSSVHPYSMTGASTKHQTLKPKSSNPKWETIVKMTKVHDQHMLYSQDRLAPIPEA